MYAVEVHDIKDNYVSGLLGGMDDLNVLISFWNKSLCTKHFSNYKNFSNNVLIDSGAFTIQKKGDEGSLKKFMEDYFNYVKNYDKYDLINGFFEMDIDGVIGYDNVKKYREKLFEVSDKIIPVWHKSLGINEFKLMCKEYNYIAVSCVGNRDIKKESYGKFVKFAHKNNCKIHGLGMTNKEVLDRVPFDSVDSSSWFKSARYGIMNNRKLDSDWTKKNRGKLIQLELIEFKRTQDYYYNKWKWFHDD